MTRIVIPSAEQTPAGSRPLLEAVQKQLGLVPNLMKVVGNSPAALEGYLSLNGALAKGELDAPTRERIALAVAQHNACEYCLAAHSYLGTNVAKLSSGEIASARAGISSDRKAAAALRFARAVMTQNGKVSNAELAVVRAAGFSDASLVEIVGAVALNILTNYINNVAQTTVDFPEVEVELAA
jgi:uncharacterized peroxidase-related enzyme